MTTTELNADIGAGANRTGAYLAFLQFVFALGWTTYVIYLPKLAAEVGIATSAVILVLMLDQPTKNQKTPENTGLFSLFRPRFL